MASPRRRPARRALVPAPAGTASPPAEARFRALDDYRVEREWKRYEGTAQRELFRRLRERFLARHAVRAGWTLDLGSGPGRFTPWVGGEATRRVAIDLSGVALARLPVRWPDGQPVPDRVVADGGRAPLRNATFAEVALLGNSLGFAGEKAEALLATAVTLLAPGGTVVLESAPGAPTGSRYLRRLPASSLPRLLRAPIRALQPRVDRESYEVDRGPDRTRHGFRPLSEAELRRILERLGATITEVGAVAPALGNDPDRLTRIRTDARAWDHLMELEEALGRTPARREQAASLLIAAQVPLAAVRGVK